VQIAHQIVPTSHVYQFMKQHGFKLGIAEVICHAFRQQDRRP
jgi:hypothetical protein